MQSRCLFVVVIAGAITAIPLVASGGFMREPYEPLDTSSSSSSSLPSALPSLPPLPAPAPAPPSVLDPVPITNGLDPADPWVKAPLSVTNRPARRPLLPLDPTDPWTDVPSMASVTPSSGGFRVELDRNDPWAP
jgi:hypothetical protein